jgi:PTH1 family peptidyl-tRNA hydrolase
LIISKKSIKLKGCFVINKEEIMNEEKKLIIGLGNPGKDYADNRHNIGFMCVDMLAERWNINIKRKRKNAKIGQGHFGDHPVILAKPQTYMNSSGISVSMLANYFRIQPINVLIIHDDLDLAFGRIRLRESGGAAGHHGMESIINKLSTKDFPRLRIGIGRPKIAGDDEVIDFVLNGFKNHEQKKLKAVLELSANSVEDFLCNGIEHAMSQFNGMYIEKV